MKLRNLNGAIRKAEDVIVRVASPMGRLDLIVKKTALLESLKAAGGGDSQLETGMWMGDDGVLHWEPEAEAQVAEGDKVFPPEDSGSALLLDGDVVVDGELLIGGSVTTPQIAGDDLSDLLG